MKGPEYPNDRSLLSVIFINADLSAYEGAKDMLERLGLPNAEEGEYFAGPNVTRLYLAEGLSVSFLHRNVNLLSAAWSKLLPSRAVESARVYAARTLKDPEILQPVFQKDLGGNCCVEIVPGTPRAKVGREDLVSIGKSLAERKIDFYTRSEEFVGILKAKDGEEARVVTNRRAVRPMASYVAAGKGDIGLQEKIYGGLRGEFHAADKAGTVDALRGVLNESAKNPDNILHAYWRGTGIGTERNGMITRSAQKYEARRASL